jgi:NNP family nitrate/nitrite transporter-like MFS transporter
MAGKKWIDHWEPDDERFWESTGKGVARRNLGFSIFAELLGFSIWVLWGVVAVKLNDNGFAFSTSQLFWLVSVPGLIGATMRFPYTFMPAKIGGRNWTIISALLLLIPAVLLAVLVRDPSTPFALLLVAAATAGFGGGNFSSSMANISHFYPEGRKGLALGLNAAGGNVGVALTLLVVPIAIAVGGLELAGLIWIPFIVVAAFCAWRFMDNLTNARSTFADQRVIVRERHTWLMTILYIGAFGSFIGYSAGLPLLIDTQFPQSAVGLAFLGPLVGSAARPLGGWLSDRLGGARVTLAVFAAMAIATLGVIFFLSQKEQSWAFAGFLATFIVLFILSGLANGSTFRMVPAIWRAQSLERAEANGESRDEALARSRREGAAVLGFIGAVAAYGGFVIPQAYSGSIAATGGVELALGVFCAYYVLAGAVTWRCYLRPSAVAAEKARAPGVGLAHARV